MYDWRVNLRVTVVLVCTFLALVAATVRVPRRVEMRWLRPERGIWVVDSSWEAAIRRSGSADPYRYEWLWNPAEEPWGNQEPGEPVPSGSPPEVFQIRTAVGVWLVLATHLCILLLGGDIVTWLVRRERRRAAAS